MIKDFSVQKINKIKRVQVKACVDAMVEFPFVNRLIIFGSSVSEDCRDDSDADICIDMNGTTKGLHTLKYMSGFE